MLVLHSAFYTSCLTLLGNLVWQGRGWGEPCSTVAATNIWQWPSCFLAKIKQHFVVCYQDIQSKDQKKEREKVITIKTELIDNLKSVQVRAQDILGRDTYQALNNTGQNSGPPGQKSLYSTQYLRMFSNQLLGVLAKLRKATISFISVCLNVHPHGRCWIPLDKFSWNFIPWNFTKICLDDSSLVTITQN